MANYPSSANTDANLYLGVNNLATVLTDNPLTAGATTVNVSDTTGFPTVGILTVDLEAIHYTGLTATSFTGCTRGFDGTTGASHPVSTTVFHDIPAAHHNVLKDEIIAVTDDIRDSITADLDDSVAAATTAGDLKIRLDHVATQIKNLSGETDWKTVPAETLSSLETSKAEDSLVVHLAGAETITGNKTVSGTMDLNGANSIAGTTTNDSATAGDVGEVVSSVSTSSNFPATTVYADDTTISLTAGDWLVSVTYRLGLNANVLHEMIVGISTTAGNSAAGLVDGDNAVNYRWTPNTNDREFLAIPSYRMSLASTTTVRLKRAGIYSSTVPVGNGRITAVRIR